MNKILMRLDAINLELKELEGKDSEVYTLIRNRRKSERDGIVFALRALGLEPTNHGEDGWSVKAGAAA